MRRWRGAPVLALTAVTAVAALAGCMGPLRTVPAQIAEPGIDPACLIGTWKQIEGWQRLTVDEDIFDIYFVENTVEFTLADDGTGTLSYDDATWVGTHPSLYADVEIVYTGAASLTYETTEDGHYQQVADFSERISTVTLRDAVDTGPGPADARSDFTFRCSDTELVLAVEDARVVYSRTQG